MRGARTTAIIRVAGAASSEEDHMSIFPTKILLATDGSTEAERATDTAVDLAKMSDSELHVIFASGRKRDKLAGRDGVDTGLREQRAPKHGLGEVRERFAGQALKLSVRVRARVVDATLR
jgi:nucleotide-binding universal stress UspA family protein